MLLLLRWAHERYRDAGFFQRRECRIVYLRIAEMFRATELDEATSAELDEFVRRLVGTGRLNETCLALNVSTYKFVKGE